jgi:hypothetical protein
MVNGFQMKGKRQIMAKCPFCYGFRKGQMMRDESGVMDCRCKGTGVMAGCHQRTVRLHAEIDIPVPADWDEDTARDEAYAYVKAALPDVKIKKWWGYYLAKNK